MTRDIDLVVALKPDDVDTVVRLFTPDYYVSREAISNSIVHESMFNLIHQESVIKVDCIVRKGSPYRRAEFERRQRITIEDFSTWIVSKEDLIILPPPATTRTTSSAGRPNSDFITCGSNANHDGYASRNRRDGARPADGEVRCGTNSHARGDVRRRAANGAGFTARRPFPNRTQAPVIRTPLRFPLARVKPIQGYRHREWKIT